MNLASLLEAIDDPSGLIHPEKHQAIAGRTHPLGGHPAYPEQAGEGAASNYEEVLASKQWQKILQKAQRYLGIPLTRQALPQLQRKLMSALELISEAEASHKDELEALAIELVFELPEFKSAKAAYEANRIQIDASLTEEPEMGGSMTSDEPESQAPLDQANELSAEKKAWLNKMVQRRHYTNAFIQGSAISNNYLFEMGGAALDAIHPNLRQAYGILMVSSEIGYWMFPQSAVIAGARAQLQVGSSKVEMAEEEEGGEKPKVVAQAKLFPVLIQEIIKGLMELASRPSLPEKELDRAEVFRKADLVDMEAWHMILGPQLWDQFVTFTEAESDRELALHLYGYLQRMDVDEFNAFMRELYSKTPRGMAALKQLGQRVKADMEAEREGGDVEESARQIVRTLILS